ncbi:hypothetical protein DFR29_104355 [Tahibacter aquaticus]|uniref:CS1 type fimbrial major subunit n=2 Tax=Tahibacter aquaticus TaxID=520092 RepID=A0A4R6Z371_9GAMM|nr:hypothetical protein DFR29_104355 [Tahibacter aquaticus]
MNRHAIPMAAGVLAVAFCATAVDASSLAAGAVPGVRSLGLNRTAGSFETSVSRLDLDTIRSTEVAPQGALNASIASAQARLAGNGLVVDFPGPGQAQVPAIVRPLGVLWRWSPPAGGDRRAPNVRVRLVGPNGQPDEISTVENPSRGVRAQLVLRQPLLSNDADGPFWSGEAELRIQTTDVAEPGTYQGRIEITFENT